jgi:hypothetical protein
LLEDKGPSLEGEDAGLLEDRGRPLASNDEVAYYAMISLAGEDP